MFDVKLFSVSPGVQFPQKLNNKKDETHIGLFKDAVCRNQGLFVQYSYFASLKHRDLKDQISNYEEVEDKEASLRTIRQCYETLTEYLRCESDNVYKINAEFLGEYFNNRSEYNPRICIRALEDGKIIDLYRSSKRSCKTEQQLSDNTGLSAVIKSGDRYLCNDIPSEIKSGYKNPRLIRDKALLYKLNLIEHSQVKYFKKQDTQWADCWEGYQFTDGSMINPKQKECYKSTLIIPVTLLGNELSTDFKHDFNIGDYEKSTYACLCFDHQAVDFFNDKIDTEVGFIFADIISLYMVTSLMYTKLSDSYLKAEKLFEIV